MLYEKDTTDGGAINQMESKMQRRCAFTGHRPHKFPWKYNEDDERCVALKAALADHRLVEAAGLLLAVYNGERRGGTAATVRYARKTGRKVFILDPASLEVMSV